VPAANDAEHIQRKDEGIVVVAEVAGVVGIVAALGRYDPVEVPVRRGQRGRAAGFGDGDIKGADVSVEINVLIADDEPPNRVIIRDDRVREAGAAVGMGQVPRGKPWG
jgi:hypothetical protein